MNTRKPRTIFTWIALLGALIMSSGFALMAAAGPTSAAEDDCVPSAAYTETTDWVLQSPGDGWRQVDSRIKTAAVEGQWTDLVWHNFTGNQPPPNEPPALSDSNWHALPADPQAANHTIPPRVPNEPYNVSHENEGRGAWFLWTGTWVPGTDAVYEYLYAFDHPAVTCEVVEPPVVEPPVVNPPTEEVSPPTVTEKTTTEAPPETTTPTVVHAGLAGEQPTTSQTAQGLALVVAGALMLAAGALGAARSERHTA